MFAHVRNALVLQSQLKGTGYRPFLACKQPKPHHHSRLKLWASGTSFMLLITHHLAPARTVQKQRHGPVSMCRPQTAAHLTSWSMAPLVRCHLGATRHC